tara:strand:- start:1027 stop:2388 length:1362 start_codon:yes stop_codon:yes gene_type:complete
MLTTTKKLLENLRIIIFIILYFFITSANLIHLILISLISFFSVWLTCYFKNKKRFYIYLSLISSFILLPLILPNTFRNYLPPGYQYICISLIASNLFIAFNNKFKNDNFFATYLSNFTAVLTPFTYLAGPSATIEEVSKKEVDPIGLPDVNSIKNGKIKLAISGFLKLSLGSFLSTMSGNIENNIFNFNFLNSYNSIFFIILFGFYNFWKYFLLFDGASELCKAFLSTIGINVIDNFNSPYLAIFYHEIWSRWHLNITDRVRNYLYMPLSLFCLRRFSKFNKIIQIMSIELLPAGILFFIIGIWHGGKKIDFIFALVSLIFTILSGLISKNNYIKKAIKKSNLFKQLVRYFSISLFGLALGIYTIKFDSSDITENSISILNQFLPYLLTCILTTLYFNFKSNKLFLPQIKEILFSNSFLNIFTLFSEFLIALFLQYKYVLPFDSSAEFMYFAY